MIAWIGFIRSSWKWEPSQSRKNTTNRMPKSTATIENRGRSSPIVSRLNASIDRNSMPRRFCGVQNRSSLSMGGAESLAVVAPSFSLNCRESTASLSGRAGSWTRSPMICIPMAQIRATIAVGYRKMTFGHMKIRMPFSRCLGVGSAEVGIDGFASVDISGILRAEGSSQEYVEGGPWNQCESHAERT